MSAIINSVLSLFIIMLIGVYGNRKKIITEDINKGLTEILLRIALPILIVSSFIITYDDRIKENVIKAFYYSFITFILLGVFSTIFLLPIKKDKKTILQFANVFSNTGYIGFPILNSIYGSEAILYGSIFQMFYTIFIWTYGIMLFKGNIKKEDIKKESMQVLLNPSIIAVFIGLLIMLFNIKLPDMMLISINSVGSMTGPLSMIIVGVILSKVRIKDYMKDWTIYYGIAIKLVILPGVIYCISLLVNDATKVVNTIVILTAMPAAIMTSIFGDSFNKEKEYATVIVFLTTILSIITLPIILKIII